jgi:hypothetical protein
MAKSPYHRRRKYNRCWGKEEALKILETYDGLPYGSKSRYLAKIGIKSGHIAFWRKRYSAPPAPPRAVQKKK